MAATIGDNVVARVELERRLAEALKIEDDEVALVVATALIDNALKIDDEKDLVAILDSSTYIAIHNRLGHYLRDATFNPDDCGKRVKAKITDEQRKLIEDITWQPE